MAKHPLWSDEYWLLLMQLYLKKPVGVKALYSRPLVALALELHIPPQYLYEQLFRLRTIDTPRMEKLWKDYGRNPRRLSRGVKLLRQKLGYADMFFEGVELNETWEKDFYPVEGVENTTITPVMLILILDQYFRLTPLTMVTETPEVQELARLLKIKAEKVAMVLEIFMQCDPYLNRLDLDLPPLLPDCQRVWQRYGNDPEKLSAEAAQMSAWYK